MFLTFTSKQVHFKYGKNRWQRAFDEIAELGIMRIKKSYFLLNAAFALVTLTAYYFMFFTNINEIYYIAPALLCYTFLIILRFQDKVEYKYYVLLKDIYQNEIKIKIKATDRNIVGKQIDEYLNAQFEHFIMQTA